MQTFGKKIKNGNLKNNEKGDERRFYVNFIKKYIYIFNYYTKK